ncbi:MAG: pyridoxine 5'-phosphate synthase [Planctomycetota bacterium]|nr:MAG: pyridoxine 5'-phosphate synthase [Planctomycetota bacterium]
MMKLGVNIDHIATVRQARQTCEPDPVRAAVLAELGGADSITVHLREDRRHIQDRDVRLLRETLQIPLNLEMAVTAEMIAIACELRPQQACLVPERRQELTTEGGLKVDGDNALLGQAIAQLSAHGTQVSLFIDPDETAIRHAHALGAGTVELHTGSWANAWLQALRDPGSAQRHACNQERLRLEQAAAICAQLGLRLHIGHGITYRNVRELLHLNGLQELNIGHSIIAHAVMVGLQQAVQDMKALLHAGPCSPI